MVLRLVVIEQMIWKFSKFVLFGVYFSAKFPTLFSLPPPLIICQYFSYRVVFTYTITILTLKTALMTAFILDFNRMSGATSKHPIPTVLAM